MITGIDIVKKTAAKPYMEYGAFEDAIFQSPVEIQTLLGAGIGMSGEVGEFNEILKKHVFQGKTFDIDHAKKELCDIYYYLCSACIALGIEHISELEEMLDIKLSARYPNGFTVEASNNRKEGDI